jgi:hypothetical protein
MSMVPPRPWQVAPAVPWNPDGRCYVLAADGTAVIRAALDEDLADLIVRAVNGAGDP